MSKPITSHELYKKLLSAPILKDYYMFGVGNPNESIVEKVEHIDVEWDESLDDESA